MSSPELNTPFVSNDGLAKLAWFVCIVGGRKRASNQELNKKHFNTKASCITEKETVDWLDVSEQNVQKRKR